MGYICISYTLYIKIQTSKLPFQCRICSSMFVWWLSFCHIFQVHLILPPTPSETSCLSPPLTNLSTELSCCSISMIFSFSCPCLRRLQTFFLKGSSLSQSTRACRKFGLSASVKVTSASAYWLRSCRLWSLFHLAVTVLVHCHHTFRELSSVIVTVFISTMTFCRYLFLVEAFVTDEGKNNEYCPENWGDAKEKASRISTWKPLTTFVCNVNLTFVSEVLK